MIYRNVTFKNKIEYDNLVPISSYNDLNLTTDDQKMVYISPPYIKPPRDSIRGGSNPADRKTNGSWYMEYHKINQASCFKQCQEINHIIPSIDFIESGKLQSIEKDF